MNTIESTPAEIELKLRLLEGGDAALQQTPAFAGIATERRQDTTRYFDTPDLALQAQGFTLRIRSGSSGYVQTLKTTDSRGGAASNRDEWEWRVATPEPVLDLLTNTAAAAFASAVVTTLRTVCVTDIERVVRRIRLEDGTEIEAAHDRGSIVAGDAREPVHELELELKHGSLAALYRLAIRLHETVPMRLAPESKSARGYRLRTGQVAAAAHMPALLLPPKVRANTALRDGVAANLGVLLANVAAAEAGDPEAVHQLRVGLRRLRSVLALFEPMLEQHAASLFAAALREFGQVFGANRDRDVFCLETLPAFAQAGKSEWSDMLRTRAEDDRAKARRETIKVLHGPAFTATVLGLAAWCEAGATEPALLGPGPWTKRLDTIAPGLLDRLARTALRRAKRIDGPERLHDLRKSLKKLRYACDFVASLYDADAVRAYRHRCASLQETLGVINDATMAPAHAAGCITGHGVALAPAVAALAAWAATRRDAAMETLGETLAGFSTAEPFWR